MKIDLNRGVERRLHGSGIEVYMYIDTPGVYLSAHGTEVPEALAAQCGFPVEQNRKAKNKSERSAAALAAIDAQFKSEASVSEVVDERDGWKLVAVSDSRFNIVDPDGNVLNAQALPSDVGRIVFEQLAPPKSVPQFAPKQEPSADPKPPKEKLSLATPA